MQEVEQDMHDLCHDRNQDQHYHNQDQHELRLIVRALAGRWRMQQHVDTQDQ